MNFVHLHCHSHYSLLDGLARLPDLVKKAKEFKMPALALTDHGVMYGAIEFYQLAKAEGIKPIIGLEAYLTPLGRHQKIKEDEKKFHLTLLAKNFTGYQNLVRLCSLAYLEGFYYKPRIDEEILKKYHSGLICLSGCLQGEIPQLILAKKFEAAKRKILFYREIFGDDFYLEIMPFKNLKGQKEVNEALIKFSYFRVLIQNGHFRRLNRSGRGLAIFPLLNDLPRLALPSSVECFSLFSHYYLLSLSIPSIIVIEN